MKLKPPGRRTRDPKNRRVIVRPFSGTRFGELQLGEYSEAGRRWCQSEYERTGNPVWVWEVIGDCLTSGTDLPAWTREYLRAAAYTIRLFSWMPPAPKDVEHAVAKATGFARRRGEANPFLVWPRHEIEVALSVDARLQINPDCHGMRAIYKDVAAQYRISVSTVKRYWSRRSHLL